MLSPTAPIYGNLSHATGRAMLDLQRTTSRTLSVNATEVAISKGNAGDASYSARLSSLSERKQHEVQNMQNFLTYAQIQDAGLENVLQVMDRMAMIAGSAANGMISTSERACYNHEFESLKETLYAMQGVLINTMTINSSFNSPPERPPPTTIVGSTVTGIKTAWMGTKTMLRIIPVPEGRCSTITVIRLLPIHP